MEFLKGVVVEDVQNKGIGKGSGIVVMGNKYGCYDPDKHGMNSISPGDIIDFGFKDTGKYKNVQGTINKVGSGGAVPIGAGTAKAYTPKGRSFGAFPIDPLDGQRSIIRQNSVTNAVNLFSALLRSNPDALKAMDVEDAVLGFARKFEAFSSGDLDTQEAKEAMDKLVS